MQITEILFYNLLNGLVLSYFFYINVLYNRFRSDLELVAHRAHTYHCYHLYINVFIQYKYEISLELVEYRTFTYTLTLTLSYFNTFLQHFLTTLSYLLKYI